MSIIPMSVLLLLGASVAQAYVPPSFFVIRMLGKKHQAFEDSRFRNKLTFYNKNGEIAYTANETLIVNSSEQASVRISDSAGGEIAHKSRKLISGRPGELDRPVLYDLIFLKEGANIFEHFKALGLPLKTEAALYADKEGNLPYKPEPYVAFDRFDNKVAVVVGDRAKARKDEPRVSLWVEKDSFLPLRAVFPTNPEMGVASEPLEFRLSSYSIHKNFLYPRSVQVFRNGSLWAKIETQEVRSAAVGIEPSAGKADVDGDLREYVDLYLKWIR